MANLRYLISTVFITLILLPNKYLSQNLSMQSIPSDQIQFGLSYERPSYDSPVERSTFSGVYQLNVNIPVSDKFNLVGNIPFIYSSYEVDYGYSKYSFDENGLGNIFIGMQTNNKYQENRRSIITFGLFLPTAEEKVSYDGVVTNFYDIQKYTPNSIGLYFNYAYQKTNVEGIIYGLEIGPSFIVPAEKNSRTTQGYLHYGFDLGYKINKAIINIEFLGLGILTQSFDNFSDRLIHSLSFGAQWEGKLITPKLFYRFYLREEYKEMIDSIIGLGIAVSIE